MELLLQGRRLVEVFGASDLWTKFPVIFCFSPFQRALLLRGGYHFMLNKHPLSPANCIHVPPCNVFTICLLAQIFEFLLSSRNPEWILVENLIATEDVN